MTVLKLTNFRDARDWKQAVLFYVVYTAIMLVVAGVAGGIAGVIAGHSGVSDHDQLQGIAKIAGMVTGALCCAALSLLVVYSKKLKDIYLILCVPLAVGFFLSGPIGMIIPAFLTTLKPAA